MRPRARRDFLRLASLGSAALASGVWRPALAAPERKLGVALLGLGRYSSGQLGPALRETRSCRLAGVVTGSPEKGAQWAKDYALPGGSVYSYETFDRIAENKDIDIVYLVTPPSLHPEFALRAAKAGKHVISEKPMATSVADCDTMIEACRKAKVMLSIGYRLHFDPYHREMVRLARDRDFGPFAKMTGDRGFVMKAKAWRVDKKLAGGGPMMDLGIYIVQGACMAAGADPVAVTATEEPKTNLEMFDQVEERIRWTMEFPGGATCDGVTSFNHQSDRFKAEGKKGFFEFTEKAFTYRGLKAVTSRGPLEFPPLNQQAAQMDDFAECILSGRKTSVPGEMGRRDVKILMAVYEAALTGKRVTL
jgi:glucose-fructose oxidoreductase